MSFVAHEYDQTRPRGYLYLQWRRYIDFLSYGKLCIPHNNELITNSLEHGLDGKAGEIRLAVSELEEYIVLDFSDTGKGLPQDFSINSNKRLGLTIINNLVTHELKGKLSVENTDVGVLVTIHMKKEK